MTHGADAPADLITRRHRTGDVDSVAVFSACGTWRYELTRQWAQAGPRVAWVMLNPSTADERRNDPTIERCQRRSVAMGYGAMRIVNLFAFRATRPADLWRAPEPCGPDNAAALADAADWADAIICGWGAHGVGRSGPAEGLLRASGKALYHLGLTQGGAPRHPLYVAYAREPVRWNAGIAAGAVAACNP